MLYVVLHSVKYNTDTMYTLFITVRKRSLGRGYVFTPRCHSVYGEGNWLPSMHHRSHDWGMSASRGRLSPGGSASRGSASRGIEGLGRSPMGYYGLRSTSERYASYWNAFLLLSLFDLPLEWVRCSTLRLAEFVCMFSNGSARSFCNVTLKAACVIHVVWGPCQGVPPINLRN